jgi:hypothetical protein
MKDVSEYEKDLSSIRNLMEKSVKFISLSGLSGVLAGVYACIGAISAYFLIHYPRSPFSYRIDSVNTDDILWKLIAIALVVLVASLITGVVFSMRKAKRFNVTFWNATSERLLLNLAIPLVTGGLFILIVLYNGHYGIAAPASLIFYGLALIQGSQYTYDEVRYLGLCEIGIGLIAALLPGYGLLFWFLGFGILHIVYGFIMYIKYEK